MSDRVLTIWVIYHGASNHSPGVWVVRAQDALPSGNTRPHELFYECGSLLEARSKVPLGLIRFDRSPGDDPVIVESWL